MLICEKLSCEEAIYYTPVCVALIFVTQFCDIPLCGKLIGGMKNEMHGLCALQLMQEFE